MPSAVLVADDERCQRPATCEAAVGDSAACRRRR